MPSSFRIRYSAVNCARCVHRQPQYMKLHEGLKRVFSSVTPQYPFTETDVQEKERIGPGEANYGPEDRYRCRFSFPRVC
jgi:hypothetical protein